MRSLVLELQEDALNPSSTSLYLLRKAGLVASKLNIQELQQWTELELSGYSNRESLPQYRYIRGEVKARNPALGWIPFIVPEPLSFLSEMPVLQAISELESLIKNESNLTVKFSTEIQVGLMDLTDCEFQFALHISTSQIHKIIESVKDIIIKWAIKLEKDGILGEGMTFSRQEKEIAQAAHYTIGTYIMTQTYNSMSDNHSTNIQAGRDASGNLLSSEVTGVFAGGDISGTVNNAINQLQTSNNPEVLQLAELLKKLQTVIEVEPALEPDDKDIALQQVAVLADEGQNPKKESGIKPVKTAVAALKGIVGALPLATKLVKEFNELLPMILPLLGLG
ncbi:AbiTii domain-containing protein [Nostoc sp.]|uniref:AbiTii domain-containing protein n=1 Tax=Nostoc sp. TaxID=1180 RepID=UPI002FF6BA92